MPEPSCRDLFLAAFFGLFLHGQAHVEIVVDCFVQLVDLVFEEVVGAGNDPMVDGCSALGFQFGGEFGNRACRDDPVGITVDHQP